MMHRVSAVNLPASSGIVLRFFATLIRKREPTPMPKNRSSNPPRGTLPDSLPALRRLIAAATTDGREDIARATAHAYPDFGLFFDSKGASPPTPARRLFEQRTIELLRNPIALRGGWMDWSQLDAMDKLVMLRSAAAPRVLRRFLRTPWPRVTVEAAESFATIGRDALVPEVRRLIRSNDPHVAQATLTGAFRSITDERASPRYRSAILKELIPLVTGKRRVPRSGMGHYLLISGANGFHAHDPHRALALFTSKRCLHASNQALWSILSRLESHRDKNPKGFRAPDPALLWSLFDAAKARRVATFPGWGATHTLTVLLSLAADTDPARTRRECTALLKQYPAERHIKKEVPDILRRCRRPRARRG
jgi:hypothetical protein